MFERFDIFLLKCIYPKDTHYIAGPNNGQWQVEDNFISAITGNGETLSVNDMTVTYGSAGQPDLSKAGTYTVTYYSTAASGNQVS
ncbi:cell surface protein [Lactiplantibacillus plantarum]|nr:cell surface protein [Lactiplantibacillus plantarum]